jgi:hypothetical protein
MWGFETEQNVSSELTPYVPCTVFNEIVGYNPTRGTDVFSRWSDGKGHVLSRVWQYAFNLLQEREYVILG